MKIEAAYLVLENSRWYILYKMQIGWLKTAHGSEDTALEVCDEKSAYELLAISPKFINTVPIF